MELYGTGFNAWNQLRFDCAAQGPDEESDDIHSFTCVLRDELIGRPRSFLSYTSVETSSGVKTAGAVPSDHDRLGSLNAVVYTDFAEAANESVVAITDDGIIHQYASLKDLLDGRQGKMFAGLPAVKQVIAYDTGFAALSTTGQVWTWGDERYGACLGRDLADSAADEPGLVSALEDLPTGPITKIAAGGYALAALTEGNDLYAWGGHAARRSIVQDLTGDPTPIIVEEDDIVDFDVGESHMIALTVSGDVFVIGENGNGQLGLDCKTADSWMKVDLDISSRRKIVGVAAGLRTSFILIQQQHS
ncbi:RCC1/BLIP-II protein [Pleurostoma richardsiae]|uniref:RCC1/BLIP-II protein n=1 Tax=Pleurostoma richardsiae TaxID=41990 RepID=A0AA38RBC1_9PEZI|nr:RCC1/BLIP-II protein [Pleurostoma richardsiae]